MNWFPVEIDIHKYPTNKKDLWKAVICFGLSGGSYTTTEITLSSDTIISSRHGFALNAEPMIQSGIKKFTAMTYSPPHLIIAHANNTMKHYLVTATSNYLEITFKQTLYGHTFRVDALAIEASKRRLVSSDRSENYINQSDMKELPDSKINTLRFDEDKIVAIMSLSGGSLVRSWPFDS
ncbi:hypothetical protein INT46_009929 [Mucor plumbeus]|uniref:Uncharacterized protein n=1 Tax=Mucor plumbeus TaxID=97098 RepID=A0A8H7R954_9FUNG|nr:hypothetical protein INT46_009929 [Mucor plumbeus]